MPDDPKTRTRVVVEEVSAPPEAVPEPITTSSVIPETVESKIEIPEKTTEAPVPVETPKPEVVPTETPVEEPKIEEPKAEESKVVSEVEPTKPTVKSGSGTNPLLIIIPGVLLLGALLGGIVFYQRGISSETAVATPTPIPLAYNNTAASPTPDTASTSGTTLDLTKYPINVLNGSGTPGQAGVVKDLLTTGGFTVSGTGNADTYDFTKTVIKAKADVPAAFLTQVSTTLSKDYVMDVNGTLATSSADEVQVIVGSTKAE
jgi:hypothetical protein